MSCHSVAAQVIQPQVIQPQVIQHRGEFAGAVAAERNCIARRALFVPGCRLRPGQHLELRRGLGFAFSCAVLLFLLFAAPAQAAQVTLAWDANLEPDIAGYIVEYERSNAPNTTAVDVGGVTTWTLPDAQEGMTYTFRVIAYNTSGELSAPSSSVTTTVLASRPMARVDIPADGSIVSPDFVIGGWAVDLGAPPTTGSDAVVGSGVDALHVWAYPLIGPAHAPVFLGVASFGARPDIAAVFGEQFRNAGFGLLVQGLPPGVYDIAAFPHSSVTGDFVAATVVRILVR